MKRLLFVLTIAVVLSTVVRTQAEPVVALDVFNTLVRFDSAAPGATSTVIASGLLPNEQLIGVDYRPSTGVLYGIANNFTTGVDSLYTINPLTGVAALVATLPTSVVGFDAGIDFDPVADSEGLPSLRVITSVGQNLRVDVDTGAVTVDPAISGVPPNPSISGVAYTDNFFGATATTLYALDPASNQLLRFTDPTAGTYVPVGALGVDPTSTLAFDMSGLSGTALAAMNVQLVGPLISMLYTIDLGTGQASLVGQIGPGNGFLLRGIATSPGDPIPEPATMLLLGSGLVGVGTAVRRRWGTRTNG